MLLRHGLSGSESSLQMRDRAFLSHWLEWLRRSYTLILLNWHTLKTTVGLSEFRLPIRQWRFSSVKRVQCFCTDRKPLLCQRRECEHLVAMFRAKADVATGLHEGWSAPGEARDRQDVCPRHTTLSFSNDGPAAATFRRLLYRGDMTSSVP